jgi:hypothetical protein
MVIMKHTNHKPTETLRKSLDGVSERSKESIKSLIETNSKQFNAVLETNKKTFDSLSKMLHDKELDPDILSTFKSSFGKSIKLSEEVTDAIIDSHTRRVNLSIDFANRFMELIKTEDLSTKEGTAKLIDLVKENLEESTALSAENMKKSIELYNEHLNFALNFNRKFADNMNGQVAAMFKLQKKYVDVFYGLDTITDWWKNHEEEKVKA